MNYGGKSWALLNAHIREAWGYSPYTLSMRRDDSTFILYTPAGMVVCHSYDEFVLAKRRYREISTRKEPKILGASMVCGFIDEPFERKIPLRGPVFVSPMICKLQVGNAP